MTDMSLGFVDSVRSDGPNSRTGFVRTPKAKASAGDSWRPRWARWRARGVCAYLETFNPRNVSFYERAGFTHAAKFDEPMTESSYVVMHRDG